MAVSVQQLRRVMRDRTLCLIGRARFDDHDSGYIVGVGSQWVLLAVIGTGYRLDGFRAVRIRDVSRMIASCPDPGFIPAAHRLFGISIPKAPAVKLNSLSALLGSIPSKYGAVVLHPEPSNPGICYVGSVQRVTARQVWLREITPNADWRDEETSYKLADITCVEFDDEYTRALVEVNEAKATEEGRRPKRHRPE